MMLADFYHPCRYASGLMYWRDDVSRIYDEFVAIDLPYDKAERLDRIAFLRDMMVDSNVSTAEKYRKV